MSEHQTESNKKPEWLKRPIPCAGKKSSVIDLLRAGGLHTVCEEAGCPNRGECFARGTATFLIMGDTCTRNCRFCGVTHGNPEPIDENEPNRIAEAVQRLALKHAVITSVTRDDLPDGGASHFVAVIERIREAAPQVTVETLVPDFQGATHAIDRVLASAPDVFNHNVETIARLYPDVRPQANYRQSLDVLAHAAKTHPCVKSGFMAGLGETSEEVERLLADLSRAGCTIVTIGQYLQPSRAQTPVAQYISPELFEHYQKVGARLGIRQVVAGPFVRSSYRAAEVFGGNG